MIHSLIISIITNNNRLSIPALGTFMRKADSGEILFISALKTGDDQLSKALSESLSISQNEADQIVKAFVESIMERVQAKGVYHLDHFGDFVLDANALLDFVCKPNPSTHSFIVDSNKEVVKQSEQEIPKLVVDVVIQETVEVEQQHKEQPQEQESAVIDTVTEISIEKTILEQSVDPNSSQSTCQTAKTLADILLQETNVKRVFESVHPKTQNDNFETPTTIHSKFSQQEESHFADIQPQEEQKDSVSENIPVAVLSSSVFVEQECEVATVMEDLLASKERKNRLAELYDSINTSVIETPKTEPSVLIKEEIVDKMDKIVGKKEVKMGESHHENPPVTIPQKSVLKSSQGPDYVMIIAIIAISLAVVVSAYYFFVRGI